MTTTHFIDALAARLGIGALERQPDGICEVVFDDMLELQLVPLDELHLLLRSRLAAVPEGFEESQTFLRRVLNRNLANLRNQRETVTLEETSREVWIYRLLRTDKTDEPLLFAALEDFLNSLEWQRNSTAVETTPASLPSPFSFIRP
jgi:hypothetical protein